MEQSTGRNIRRNAMDRQLNDLIDRFMNLRELQREFQLSTIKAHFTETDLKTIIYYLGELRAIKETEHEDP